MLKFSTKGRYGMRAMVELAKAYGNGPVMMNSIVESQGITRKYLHALLTSLKNAGLVRAERGMKGGFSLTKPPPDILVKEICEVLEGQISVVNCVMDADVCDKTETCKTRELWKSLNSAVLDVMSNKTLADLID